MMAPARARLLDFATSQRARRCSTCRTSILPALSRFTNGSVACSRPADRGDAREVLWLASMIDERIGQERVWNEENRRTVRCGRG